jgi:hypothetical protein
MHRWALWAPRLVMRQFGLKAPAVLPGDAP